MILNHMILTTLFPRSGHSYSPDRQYFALVERHSNKEHLCVYDAGDRYNLVRVSVFSILVGRMLKLRQPYLFSLLPCQQRIPKVSPGHRVAGG
jgi:hypothetical protein